MEYAAYVGDTYAKTKDFGKEGTVHQRSVITLRIVLTSMSM
jgi:hypothetical protein